MDGVTAQPFRIILVPCHKKIEMTNSTTELIYHLLQKQTPTRKTQVRDSGNSKDPPPKGGVDHSVRRY